MLKIAKSVEYSVLALRYIAENESNGNISVKEISERENIPFDLLAKLMQKLVKHNIIVSKQGKQGGYSLNVSPAVLTLNDIIIALEQQIQLTDCMVDAPTKEDCARYKECCLRSPLSKVQDKIIDLFKETTLIEIIN